MDANDTQPDARSLPRLGLIGGSIAIVIALALLPIDGWIARVMIDVRANVGGDIKRELETLQQFGAAGSLIIVALIILLQDPGRRARLLDLLAGVVLTALVVYPMKVLVGRPRPRIELLERDPDLHLVFLTPFRAYDFGPDIGLVHAWELGERSAKHLTAMPSAHTAYAVVLGTFLAVLYPRLRPMLIGLVAIVGFARVLFGAHYPSDVVIAAAIAFAITERAVSRRLWSGRLGGRPAS